MEAKIAEIICTHCKSGSTCDQRYCDETNAMIKAILALIAADRAGLVALLRDALPIIEQTIKDCGGCDHSVGICMCGEIKVAEDIEQALKEVQNG